MVQKFANARSRKGFTLIEMLVVIAIIAVLVAIIIPVVVNSRKKAAAATDAANLRAAIAEASVYALTNSVGTQDDDMVFFTQEEVTLVGTASKQDPTMTLHIYIMAGQPDAYFMDDAGTKILWLRDCLNVINGET